MMIDYVFLAVLVLLTVSIFDRAAWTGRIDFGRKTLLDRLKDPGGFWVAWSIFVGLVAFGFAHGVNRNHAATVAE